MLCNLLKYWAMFVKGKKKKPGFSSALLLSIPVNGSCFSMWFEEPRRVVFLKTQLLMVLHHPPPYSKVYITLSMAKKIVFKIYDNDQNAWTLLSFYIPLIEWANYLHPNQIRDESGNQVMFHPNILQLFIGQKIESLVIIIWQQNRLYHI
jgi:hypothetical protein